ncbi:MAG: hypothetical protein HW389_3255, partial [Bacteroidetes bacterium]|nr:hypothetical protein [Bacteroidota bacterium]
SAGDVRIDCDMISDGETNRLLASVGHNTGIFMPQDHRRRGARNSFDDMQIGATNAASSNFDQNFIAFQLAEVFVCDVELMRFLEECDFHGPSELSYDVLSLFRTLELYADSAR